MENDREIKKMENGYRRSNARENFRHLNSSNRNRVGKYINRNSELGYIRDESEVGNNNYSQEKMASDFSRFLISTVILALVVLAKIIDIGLFNAIEDKAIEVLRTETTVDSKLTESFLVLSEKIGINLDEIKNSNYNTTNNISNESEYDSSLEDNQLNNEGDEQIADFYIDEEILESVFEEGKK